MAGPDAILERCCPESAAKEQVLDVVKTYCVCGLEDYCGPKRPMGTERRGGSWEARFTWV